MKKLIIILFLVGCIGLFANPPTGVEWGEMSPEEKTAYLSGVRDGMMIMQLRLRDVNILNAPVNMVAFNTSTEFYIQTLDTWFAATGNLEKYVLQLIYSLEIELPPHD